MKTRTLILAIVGLACATQAATLSNWEVVPRTPQMIAVANNASSATVSFSTMMPPPNGFWGNIRAYTPAPVGTYDFTLTYTAINNTSITWTGPRPSDYTGGGTVGYIHTVPGSKPSIAALAPGQSRVLTSTWSGRPNDPMATIISLHGPANITGTLTIANVSLTWSVRVARALTIEPEIETVKLSWPSAGETMHIETAPTPAGQWTPLWAGLGETDGARAWLRVAKAAPQAFFAGYVLVPAEESFAMPF